MKDLNEKELSIIDKAARRLGYPILSLRKY